MLYDMNNQLQDLQSTISNLEYEEFSLRSRFAKEDERAASDDLERQQGWFDEVEAEYNALVSDREEFKQADGSVLAADQATVNELNGQINGLE